MKEKPLVQFIQGSGVKVTTDGWLSVDTDTMYMYLGFGDCVKQIVCDGGLFLDEYPKQASRNAVMSGGVYDALLKKQDILIAGRNIEIDTNNVISAKGGEVTSEDGSVTVTPKENGYDLSILSPEIIKYLNDLCTFKYVWPTDIKNITITLPALKGTGSVKFNAGRYRGLDNTTAENPQSLSVTNTTSTSSGWIKKTTDTWTYDVELSSAKDASVTSKSITASVTNSDNKVADVKATISVTIVKPWFLFTCDTFPTTDILNNLIANPSSAEKTGTKAQNNVAISFVTKHANYFYIAVPNTGRSGDFLQKGDSIMMGENAKATQRGFVETDYGLYKIYQSKSKQGLNETMNGNINITL